MKNILLLPLVILMMVSCKEEAVIESSNQGDLPELNIDVVLDFLPEHLKEESRLVYVNQSGDERRLNVFLDRSVQERIHEGRAYLSESIVININDEIDSELFIIVSGSSNYFGENDIVTFLSPWLRPMRSDGSVSFSIHFDDSGPDTSDPIFEFIFRGTQTYNGREFKEVYGGIGKDNQQVLYAQYSELIFNSEVGVVGFRDRNDELWVFDRVED